jgi:predicted dehydrogenase
MLGLNPLFRRARDIIAGGELGGPCSFRASTRLSRVFAPLKSWEAMRDQSGGGVLIHEGAHLLMALHQMFGRPARVTARGRGIHNQVEDTVGAILEYDSGLWGTVEIDWCVPGHENPAHAVEAIGPGGTIEVGAGALRLWLAEESRRHHAGWTVWPRSKTEPLAEFSLTPDYCGDEYYLEDLDFVEAVRKQAKPRVGVAEALAIQEVIDAMYRSMAGGGPVDVGREETP